MRITEYQALRDGSAVVPRADRGTVRVQGNDRRSFLQGLLTNDVAALQPGASCYAAWLTPQGRMTADMHVVETGSELLLDVAAAQAATIAEKLDQLIFSEDAAVRDVSAEFSRLTLAGPAAPRVFQALALPGVVNYRDEAWDVPVIELFVPAADAGPVERVLREAGAVAAALDALDVVRIESGVPLFGVDMDENTIPLEAGIEQRAISFTKGCYVGQEVVIRVLHRGHGRVARRLVRLAIAAAEQDLPSRGTPLSQGGKQVGSLTSVAWSPRQSRGVALGYVHRDSAEPGVSLDGGITVL